MLVDRGNIGDWQLVWQGKQLGNYRLEELIGKGGFGEVYRATELGLERSVAVKVLIGPEDISDNVRVKLLERFSQEARLIALTCSEPPAGRARWTLELLVQQMLKDGIVTRVSPETVRLLLKKTNSNLGK